MIYMLIYCHLALLVVGGLILFVMLTFKGALEIRCIVSLVDLITKAKFSNSPNVFKIDLIR